MITPTAVGSLFLLLLSVPIFVVFGVGGGLLAVYDLNLPWSTLIEVSMGGLTKHVLLAIPLFILAGMVMLEGGVSRRLVSFTTVLVGHLPGGLGIAMVLAMGFMAAFSGSVLAAITAVGTILMPKMIEAGYPRAFVVCLATTAAFIEGLIPPSNAAILFSALTLAPLSKTFAAGILPGFVFMALLTAFVIIRCRDYDRMPRAGRGERRQALMAALPGLVTPLIIFVGIYGGYVTPTESAALAGLWAAIAGAFIYRELKWSGFKRALIATATITTAIFAIIAMASFLSVVLTYTRLPQSIVESLSGYGVTPFTFLAMTGVICVVLGTFLEVIPIFYIVVPILLASSRSLGIDIYHFYIVFIAFVSFGLLTPPVCVGIYTAAATINEPPERVFREIPAFLLFGLAYALVVMLIDPLSTWLPGLM